VRPRRSSDAGFGILDLVIVAALISTVAFLSVPSVSASRDGHELATASASIAAKFSEARTHALNRNRTTWVLVTPAARTLQIQTGGGRRPVDINAAEVLPMHLSIVAPVGQQSFAFDLRGRPVDNAGVVTAHVIQVRHADTHQTRAVTVTTIGDVTID
jgi:Tfp pilus assembly protein FimT